MKENSMFKYGEDLDRYEYIADYFVDNPDRLTRKNKYILEKLSESLRKDLFQDVDVIFDHSIKKIRRRLEDVLSGRAQKILNNEAQN